MRKLWRFTQCLVLVSFICPSLVFAVPAKPSCADKLSRPVKFASNSTLSKEWIDSMRARKRSKAQKALDQAVQNSGYKEVALNREVIANHNDRYTNELDTGCVTTQENSGRCWIFAGNNMLRTGLLNANKVGPTFNFSFNYLHFFSMLERANLWISNMEKSQTEKGPRKEDVFSGDLGDGGWFTWYQFLVQKYGLAPKAAMIETAGSTNTSMLLEDIRSILTIAGLEIKALTSKWKVKKKYTAKQKAQLLEIRQEAMAKIYTILVTHLGQPPEKFNYNDKEFTPESFRDEFVEFDPSEFVVVYNNPRLPYNKQFQVTDASLAVTDKKDPNSTEIVLNLPFKRMDQLIRKSIDSGMALWFATSVSSMLDASPATPSKPATGIWHPRLYEGADIYGLSRKDFEHKRVDRMELRLSMPTHAMLITGYDRPNRKKGTVKYKVENSWGSRWADGGYGHMYREWAEIYLDAIVVHRSLLNEEELKQVSAKPTPIKSDDFF